MESAEVKNSRVQRGRLYSLTKLHKYILLPIV
jgi:hypothetical protein